MIASPFDADGATLKLPKSRANVKALRGGRKRAKCESEPTRPVRLAAGPMRFRFERAGSAARPRQSLLDRGLLTRLA